MNTAYREESEAGWLFDDLPASPVLAPIRNKGYGSIADLPDGELADPDELERLVYLKEFEPVLMLPVRRGTSFIKPAIDDAGRIDWGAFGTVDFDGQRPEFDAIRYKVGRLYERLRDKIIMFEIVKERVPGITKYVILNRLRRGIIELGDILDCQMYFLASLYMEVRGLKEQIAQLKEVREQRQQDKGDGFLEG